MIDLASRVQVISLHCDSNPTSTNIISRDVLSALPKGAMLVNTARGGLVDEVAALEALQNGQLSYLGLDVFASEPHSNLQVVNQFHNIDLLPHAAGFHQHLLEDIQKQLVDICQAFVQGADLPLKFCLTYEGCVLSSLFDRTRLFGFNCHWELISHWMMRGFILPTQNL